MTKSVIRELEKYGRQAEDLAPPIQLSEIAHDGAGSSDSPKLTWRPRGLLVGVAAAIAIVILVGGAAILGLFEGAEEVADPSPTTTPAPPDSPDGFVVAEATPVAPVVWVSVSDDDLRVSGIMNGLAAADAEWIAVGSQFGATAGVRMPAIWTSSDGQDWISIEAPAFRSGLGEANAAAVHTGRIVVVGSWAESSAAAIWYSDDGSQWVSVELPGSTSRLSAIVVPVSNAGFVAVGDDAWFSPDGKQWTRSELAGGSASTVLEFHSGLIAAGSGDSGHAVVWTSADIGNSWQSAEVDSRPDLFESSAIYDIIETDEGYTAIGTVVFEAVSRPAAWTSPNGSDWTLVWADLDGSGIMQSMALSGGQLVAVGTDPSGVSTGAIWLSADQGVTWVEQVDRSGLFASALGEPGARMHSIHRATEGMVVAVGGRNGSPAVWVGGLDARLADPVDDTETTPGWTCQARIENGAVWSLGSWDEASGSYMAESPLACLDILDVHATPQQWKVVWEGSASTLEVGLMLVFEQGIHGEVYAEIEVDTESGEWVTPVITPDGSVPFTFVVMPHSFDSWEHITFSVTPCSLTECG